MDALRFFAAQLFQEMIFKSPSSELVITNMLDKVVLNCSARELKTDPKDKTIKFTHTEVFATAFIYHFYKMITKKLDKKVTTRKKIIKIILEKHMRRILNLGASSKASKKKL